MKKAFKQLGLVLGVLLLCNFAYGFYSFATGAQRMTRVCGQIHPGMSIDELRKFSDENGLLKPHTDNGRTALGEGRTMGRHRCVVVLEAGKVTSSVHQFMD